MQSLNIPLPGVFIAFVQASKKSGEKFNLS